MDHQKHCVPPRGRWRAFTPGDRKTAGLDLRSPYSPVGWFSCARAAAQRERAQKHPPPLQVCVNTVLGEVRDWQGEVPDGERLCGWGESYALHKVGARGLLPTAGADVQKGRTQVRVAASGSAAIWGSVSV